MARRTAEGTLSLARSLRGVFAVQVIALVLPATMEAKSLSSPEIQFELGWCPTCHHNAIVACFRQYPDRVEIDVFCSWASCPLTRNWWVAFPMGLALLESPNVLLAKKITLVFPSVLHDGGQTLTLDQRLS